MEFSRTTFDKCCSHSSWKCPKLSIRFCSSSICFAHIQLKFQLFFITQPFFQLCVTFFHCKYNTTDCLCHKPVFMLLIFSCLLNASHYQPFETKQMMLFQHLFSCFLQLTTLVFFLSLLTVSSLKEWFVKLDTIFFMKLSSPSIAHYLSCILHRTFPFKLSQSKIASNTIEVTLSNWAVMPSLSALLMSIWLLLTLFFHV